MQHFIAPTKPKKLRGLTTKQKAFADKYLETGNGVISVRESYNVKNDNVASNIASVNLVKPNIREYLEWKAESAVSMIFELSQNAESEMVRLSACKDILDRAGFKPTEKSQVIGVGVDLSNIEYIQAITYRSIEQMKQDELRA